MTQEQIKRLKELREKAMIDDMTDNEWDEYIGLTDMKETEENMSKLEDICEEAFERVWFNRNIITEDADIPGISEEIKQTALENAKRIQEKYNISDEDIDDFYHGYWSGILALSRFLLGGYGTDLDDLRNGNELLDT